MALSPALQALVKGAQSKYSRSNNNIVKLAEGKTKVRVLQKDPEGKFWADRGVHWIKLEKGGKPVAVVGCHDHVHETPCPVCTAIDKASKAASDDETLNIIKEWKVKKSILVIALIRSGDKASAEPVILEITPTVFSQILSIMEEYAEDYGNIFDPNTGIDLVIERKGKGLDTEYSVMPAPKSEKVPKGTLDKVVDLDAFIEKEDFRGDEKKALNAIAGWTGIDLRGIGGPAAATARLTAVAPADKDDFTAEKLTPKAAPEATAAPAASAVKAKAKAMVVEAEEESPFETAPTAASDELDDILEGLEGL